MAVQIVRGSIQDSSRKDAYDDDGEQIAVFALRVNGRRYGFTLPRRDAFYLDDGPEVILALRDDNKVVAGACPKQGLEWGETHLLNDEVSEADAFSIAEGKVVEKRREVFTRSRGVSFQPVYLSSWTTTVTYTIVLPDQRFRVVESIGKHIKPNTHITALTMEGAAFIVHVRESGRTYGKPGWSWLISLALWVGFNLYMLYMAETGQKAVFTDYNMVLIIGNIFLALFFIFPFTGFLSERKSLRLFKEMTGIA